MPTAIADTAIAEPYRETAAAPNRFSLSGLLSRYQLVLLLLIAAIWMARSPYSSSNLEVPPDSVEYALAPAQLLEIGHYQIVAEGRGLPPRYPPWFSVVVILPVYVLLGAEPGNAIFGITIFAVGGVGIAWAIGRKISGGAGGILAALGLLAVPSYSAWSTQVMSDVPCAVLVLAGCWLFLQIRARAESDQLSLFWAAGFLIALATLFRPVSAAMLLPLAVAALVPWRFRRALARSTALLVPMFGAAAIGFAYNKATFGSPFRSGYDFWSWTGSTRLETFFSISSVGPNCRMLFGTAFPILLGICVATDIVLRGTRPSARNNVVPRLRDLIFFVAGAGIPILVFYLFYSYPSDRFFLPILAGVAVIAGSLLGLLIDQGYQRTIGVLLVGLILLVTCARIVVPEPIPQRRIAADRIRQNTPADAIIISTIDPVFLEQRVARGSERRIMPLSRDVEYARAVYPPTQNSKPRYIIQFVATEQIQELVAEARRGRRLFLDATGMEKENADALHLVNSRFRMSWKAPALYELAPL
ncbi:MAG: ArnT family glycosyltransferase [Chthoniobacterales bacterium]